jgi:hypothetical protein
MPCPSGQAACWSDHENFMLSCYFLWQCHVYTAKLHVGQVMSISSSQLFFFFLINVDIPGQLTYISTNPMGPEVNDHVNFQWPWDL